MKEALGSAPRWQEWGRTEGSKRLGGREKDREGREGRDCEVGAAAPLPQEAGAGRAPPHPPPLLMEEERGGKVEEEGVERDMRMWEERGRERGVRVGLEQELAPMENL